MWSRHLWAEEDSGRIGPQRLTAGLNRIKGLRKLHGVHCMHKRKFSVTTDSKHLERALRVIPMGRKNWLFCWTELGAKHVGIVQSLLVTCRLHDIDPYDYFVDVLQRIGQHLASKVDELTPRRWKQLFAANPLRSDLYGIAR